MCVLLCASVALLLAALMLLYNSFTTFFFVPCRVVQDIALFCNFSIISYFLAIKYYTLLLSISL